VLRLLRGESLEAVSRELRVPAVRLAGWRDDFLEGGTARLLARPTSPAEFQLRKAQAKIGELMMRLELHEKKDMMRAARRRSEG
jgi:transposase